MIVRITFKGQPELKLKMRPKHSIGVLMARLRRHIQLEPSEAIFLFTPEGVQFPMSKLLGSIPRPVVFEALKESTFGAISKMFISASIKTQNSVFIVRIKYSFWGLYYFEEISTHTTLETAKEHILTERCGGHLVVE
ncbi:MAG: hypothetical protein ACXAD7_20425 [Candidatus Kariarchaeaceae archaeon]|jgi:hypothetical protein